MDSLWCVVAEVRVDEGPFGYYRQRELRTHAKAHVLTGDAFRRIIDQQLLRNDVSSFLDDKKCWETIMYLEKIEAVVIESGNVLQEVLRLPVRE